MNRRDKRRKANDVQRNSDKAMHFKRQDLSKCAKGVWKMIEDMDFWMDWKLNGIKSH